LNYKKYLDKLLTKYDKVQLFNEFELYLKKQQKKQYTEPNIPLSIFSEQLTPFESLVKFLFEQEKLGFSDIGQLLRKDRRVVWITYKRAIQKIPLPFEFKEEEIQIPLSKFSSKQVSIAEQLVLYLKEIGLKNSQISFLIKKDERTIWTLHHRAITKEEKPIEVPIEEKIIGSFQKNEKSISGFEKFLEEKYQKEDIQFNFPINIFCEQLTPFESLVKFLFEQEKLGFSDIGQLLRKDRRVVWTTYKRASEKFKEPFAIIEEAIRLPLSELVSDKLSIAELVVAYLKDKLHLRNSQVGSLIKKDEKTVWTLYHRAIKKRGDSK
jgi:hypothetical protein